MTAADAFYRRAPRPPPDFQPSCERTGAHARASADIREHSSDEALMDFISILSIFVLACFVGYYVVWSVTPALHTPLMSVTNAISSVIVVGALIASAAGGSPSSKWLGLVAVALASVNIFGGFAVTQRMLSMYKKRERP
jgi:H+-translocating NAD(P) transhydrogenase subunit alpha